MGADFNLLGVEVDRGPLRPERPDECFRNLPPHVPLRNIPRRDQKVQV